MQKKSSPLVKSLLPILLTAGALLGPTSRSEAGVVAGDFEARLDNALLKVNISVVPGKAPTFSAQVVSAGVSKAVTGTFQAGTESDWAAALVVPGVREITLRYLRTGDPDQINESVQAGYVTGDAPNLVVAKQAYRPDGTSKISKTFSVAYKLGSEATPESIQTKVDECVNRIEEINTEIDEVRTAGLAEKKAAVVVAAAAVKAKTAALAAVQSKNPLYYSAYNAAAAAESTASKALEAAADAAYAGIKGAFSATKGLVADSVSVENAAMAIVTGIKNQADSATSQIEAISPTAARDIAAAAAFAKANITNLMTSKAANYSSTLVDPETGETPWISRINEYCTEANIDLSSLGGLFPDTFRAADARVLFVKIGPLIHKIWDATATSYTKKSELRKLDPLLYAESHPTFDPAEGETAQQELDGADLDLASATTEAASAQGEIDALRALIVSQTAQKALLLAALDLLKFQGYGVASVAAVGTSVAGCSAVISGVAADGQKWTYAAKVRSDESGIAGGVLFNTLAGKNILEGAFTLDVLGDGSGVAGGTDGLSWNSLACACVGPAPAVVSSRTKNLFGLTDKLAVTTAVVAFGSPDETGAVTSGFGAQITALNTVKKYLVAKKGTELKISVGPNVSFLGKFAHSGATPLPFSGVFINTDPGDPGIVEGFGCLLQDAKNSVAVKIASVQNGSGSMQAPMIPEIAPPVVWKGFKSSTLTVQLDAPSELNVTTVILMKGTKVVATAEANARGLASLNISGAVSGNGYTVKVVREYIGGQLEPAFSTGFEVVQKTPPVGTFQCLLSYESMRGMLEEGEGHPLSRGYDFTGSPDGNPYRARLSVTTTLTGAWSGKLEFIDLRVVNDENGEVAPSTTSVDGTTSVGGNGSFETRMPVLVTYALKGVLTPSFELPQALVGTAFIPATGGTPAHDLTLSIADAEPSGAFETLSAANVFIPTLSATMTVDKNGTNPKSVVGSCQAATKGVSGAKGKYTTAGISAGSTRDTFGDLYTFDYSSGAAIVAYTFKAGSVSITGSASVARSGQIPLLLPPRALVTDKLNYTVADENGVEKSLTSTVVSTGYGFLLARFANLQPAAPKAAYGVLGVSPLFLSGAALEASPGSAAGYRFNTAWANADASYEGTTPGGFGYSRAILVGVRPLDFSSDDRVALNTEYRLHVFHTDGFETDYQVKFSAVGDLILTNNADKAVLSKLSVAKLTGLFTGSIKPEGGSTALLVSGSYVRDDFDAGSGMMARGSSADGELTWTLYR